MDRIGAADVNEGDIVAIEGRLLRINKSDQGEWWTRYKTLLELDAVTLLASAPEGFIKAADDTSAALADDFDGF